MNKRTDATLHMQKKERNIFQTGFVKLSVLLPAILMCCGKDIRIAGLDAQKWREDAHGCKGYREKVAPLLIEQRKLLVGANEKEIKNLLGTPDAQEIQTRGQHYFMYEVKNGRGCVGNLNPATLRIRFDALNRVSELAIY